MVNKEFELYLAKHCAPVLFCKKPAALLAAAKLPKNCAWEKLQERGFCVFRLCFQKKPLVLLYHPALLSAALSRKAVQETLSSLGYPAEGGWRTLLCYLRRHFLQASEFPHEVGFFLGYPPEDVLGFMACKKNSCMDCKLCGQWKVFGDADQAARLFHEYACCKKALLCHIENGGSIFYGDLPALAG